MSNENSQDCCCHCLNCFLFLIIISIGGILFAAPAWFLFGIRTPILLILYTIGIGVSIIPAYYIFSRIRRLVNQKRERKRAAYYRSLAHRTTLSKLTPRQFEEAVANLLRRNGYQIKLTQIGADYGADMIAQRGGRTYVVEVKRYTRTKKVGRPALQKLQGAREYHKTHGMIFVTLGQFTQTAITYAKELGIHLIDGDHLLKLAQTRSHTTVYKLKNNLSEQRRFQQ